MANETPERAGLVEQSGSSDTPREPLHEHSEEIEVDFTARMNRTAKRWLQATFLIMVAFLMTQYWTPPARKFAAPQRSMLDWDMQNKLPPWMSSIKEGSQKGVALMLGQSLKPDGTPPAVLVDRAMVVQELLENKTVDHIIVCGGDPAGVGLTEAWEMKKVLTDIGVDPDAIIMETQSTTTAENAWFSLRWLPQGTGQLYIVTSDFHMPRAMYIFEETLNHFYAKFAKEFADAAPSSWKGGYPELKLHPVPTQSFCGSDASRNTDGQDGKDINTKSLAFRAANELKWMADMEVPEAFEGEPKRKVFYIWGQPIDVNDDPQNDKNFECAVLTGIENLQKLCVCQAPPEGQGPKIPYPLKFPLVQSQKHKNDWKSTWKEIVESCQPKKTA